MIIDPQELTADQNYRLLIGTVVPRPIAWVTTTSALGVNLAPFSCFTFVSKLPPMVGMTVGPRGSGAKDTLRNIYASEEYVVNIGDETMVEAIHLSSRELPPTVSEVDELGLDCVSGERVGVPRLKIAPINLECRLRHVVGYGRVREVFVVGEVLLFHVRDDLVENGKVITERLRPLARLGGPKYAPLGPILTMPSVAVSSDQAATSVTASSCDTPTVLFPPNSGQ